MSGKILNSICYALRKSEKVKDLAGVDVNVKPAFPYDPNSESSSQTALKWSRQKSRYDIPNDKIEPEIIFRLNDPIELTILSLEFRGNGGRAYRVIDSNKYLFDLREDQLVEAITQCGISAGGKINGTFVWGKLASTTRLMLVGGKLHTEMLELTEAIKNNSISPSKLKPNSIYETPSGIWRTFIGRAKMPNGQKYYAFYELPDYPTTPNTVDRDYKQWAKLTLTEKFASHEKNLGTLTEKRVFFIANPKFIREIGTMDVSSLKNVDESVSCNTSLVYDLSEDWWTKVNGQRPQRNNSWNYYNDPKEQALAQAFRENTLLAMKKTRKDFGDLIVWF